jgi:hypothetical protein
MEKSFLPLPLSKRTVLAGEIPLLLSLLEQLGKDKIGF